MVEMRRFEGKVAVVTGGGSGIGAATVRRLAAEGAQVVVGDINETNAKQVASDIGENALGVQFDAEDVSSVEALINAAVEHFGHLDVNMRGYLAGCKYAIPHMLAAGGGPS